MKLGEIYTQGKALLQSRDIGFTLNGVETEFVLRNNRREMERYTFRQHCIDATAAVTGVRVLGVDLAAPVIMSAMTMPIPAIADEGMLQLARGLKAAGSLMWTGTPIPEDLAEIAATGVALAANVKPYADRKKMFQSIDEIQAVGVQWVGIEIDSGQGTKIGDQQMARNCAPLSSKELAQIRKCVKCPLIFKGVLSRQDALKTVDAGADAILISNHGAHTIDYLPHPFQVMDDIVPVVQDQTVIMVDGGFRRGSDVMKGLCFGAALVGLGRPILYALAAGGAAGVEAMMTQISAELKRVMTMTGAANPDKAARYMLIEGGYRSSPDI